MADRHDPIVSNFIVYRQIAVESLARAQEDLARHTRPRDDGAEGQVKTFDPTFGSFKSAMVAIVFAGIYMEAILWIYGTNRLGVAAYEVIDRRVLEKRAEALGLTDPTLIEGLRAYREVRRDLVHEKALPVSQYRSPIRVAQREAQKVVDLMELLDRRLRSDAT